MKKNLFAITALLSLFYTSLKAQTNTFPSTGNVGIGTTSPSAKLDVNDAGANVVGLRVFKTVGGANTLEIGNNFSGGSTFAFNAGISGVSNGGLDIRDVTNSASRLVISTSGNVGIGTTNPPLIGNYGVLALDGRSTSQGGYLSLMTSGTELGAIAANTQLNFIASSGITTQFYTGSTPTMQISTAGNVGIGTTSPSAKLEVSSGSGVTSVKAVGANGYLLIDNVGSGESYYQANTFHQFQGTSGAAILTMFNNGKVGVGTTTPDELLSVKGVVHSQEVKVDLTGWSDYVLKPAYKLPALSSVKAYIDKNSHLPEIPSESEIVKSGLKVGEMNRLLMKKVEELTLYLIEKDKQVEDQAKVNQKQSANIKLLQSQLRQIKKQITAATKH